jgi:hypothetical protein
MSRWQLELTYAGQTFDLSGQVDTQLTASFSVFSGTIAEISEVSFTLDLGIDIGAAVERGYDLSGATGTLSLDGERVLVGRAIRPVYGDPKESLGMVHLTLRESVIDDTSLTPGPLEKVDSTSWPNHDANVRERVYPQPFGAPGDGVGPGSPCYLVDIDPENTQYGLIAGFTVQASSVRIHNASQEWTDIYSVSHVDDGRGIRVAVVDFASLANLVDEGDELWTEWSGGISRSGRAGDLLATLMSQSAMRVDPGRLDAAIQPLNSLFLAGYYDERVNPMEYIGDNLLPILPLTIARDVDGLFPLVYRHNITASEAAAHIVVEPGICTPISSVTYEGDPVTEMLLEYQRRADTGDYLRTAIATEDDNDFAATARLRYRGDAHDGRYSTEMSTDIVYDPATADRIIAMLMERNALRARSTQYEVDKAVHGALVKAGTFVTITDPARSWNRKPAWVTARTDTTLGITITLLLKDELTRDLH